MTTRKQNIAIVVKLAVIAKIISQPAPAPISYLHLSYNRDGAFELLVNHRSENAHHKSTSIIQLNSTLGKLGLLIEGIPSEVKTLVKEVTRELSPSNVLHDEKLEGSYKCNNLKKSSLGDSSNVGDGVEGSSSGINVSGKVNPSTGDDVSEECKLCNTSVLDLNITEAVASQGHASHLFWSCLGDLYLELGRIM